MKFRSIYSPNFDYKKRSRKSIKFIIIHYTGMQSERESLIRLCNPKSKVSCHYFIRKNGKISKLVDDYFIAWHAGKSYWKNYKNLNKNSIGIELVNKGHQFGYTNFKKKQILSLISVCKKLLKKYKIKKKNIIGHSDIAPTRKIDPGEKFPWEQLARNQIGIWHFSKSTLLKKYRNIKDIRKIEKIKFIENLKKIGYCVSLGKKSTFSKTLKAFQRHHRKELVNGFLDRECLIIAKNLSKKL